MNQTSTASNMESEEKIRLWLAKKYGVRGVFITLGCVAEILGMVVHALTRDHRHRLRCLLQR